MRKCKASVKERGGDFAEQNTTPLDTGREREDRDRAMDIIGHCP